MSGKEMSKRIGLAIQQHNRKYKQTIKHVEGSKHGNTNKAKPRSTTKQALRA
jgi:hypothetical protein